MRTLILCALISGAVFAQETFTFSYDFTGMICTGLADNSSCSTSAQSFTDKEITLVDDGTGAKSGSFEETKTFGGIDFKSEVYVEGDGSGFYSLEVIVYEIIANLSTEMPIASAFTYNQGTSLSMPLVLAKMSNPYFVGGHVDDINTAQFIFPVVYLLPSGTKEMPFSIKNLKRFR